MSAALQGAAFDFGSEESVLEARLYRRYADEAESWRARLYGALAQLAECTDPVEAVVLAEALSSLVEQCADAALEVAAQPTGTLLPAIPSTCTGRTTGYSESQIATTAAYLQRDSGPSDPELAEVQGTCAHGQVISDTCAACQTAGRDFTGFEDQATENEVVAEIVAGVTHGTEGV